MKIFITGICGAVGSNLAKYLLNLYECKIWGIDDLSSGMINNIQGLDVEFIQADICNDDILRSLFENQFDYIFHLAAHFANQNSIDNTVRDLQVNSEGTLKLLEHAKKQKKLKRFVYTSTSCIYSSSTELLSEDNELHFETPYAISKYFGEEYIKFYSDYYNIPCSIVRLFNSFGPGEFPGKYRNVIPNFINHALNNEIITIFGDGGDTRCFSYVDDIIIGITKSSMVENSNCSLFNLGNDKEVKIIDLANLIIELTKSESNIFFGKKRAWDKTTHRRPDILKAKKILDFQSKTNLKDGLIKTINWFENNLEIINQMEKSSNEITK